MTDRIVLAYSGGLDTSVAIGWIGEATGAEVIAVAVDVGQGGESLETVRQRALGCGAVEAYVADDPWTAACQAYLSFTISRSLLKFMFIESVMTSNHLILCHSPSPPALNLSQHQGLFK